MSAIRISPQRQRQMERAYEVRNLQGFEGDSYMRERVQQLIKEKGIETVIELGTYLGGTARAFASVVKTVVTVEINKSHFKRANKMLSQFPNVVSVWGDSVEVLPETLSHLTFQKNLLIWIDSHWEANNPLLQELDIIARFKLKPVLCIHDFKVPNRPDLGFDTYKDIIYEWDWIKESVEKIYGVDGYVKEYNDKATGAKRGIVYIYPK